MGLLAQLANNLMSPWGSVDNPIVNPEVQASVAGTNTFTYPVTHVSGTEAMVDITVPYNGFAGNITLIPSGAFTGTNAGNIGIAFTAVVGRPLVLTYSPVTSKWYPSYVS